MLLLAVLLFWRLQLLIRSFNQIIHTNNVEMNLQQAVGYLKDAQASQHSYILTHDAALLQPYITGEPRIDSTLHDLERQTNDNPVQQQNIASLRSLVRLQFELFKKTILNPHDSTRVLRELLGRSQVSMERIQSQVYRMSMEEKRLLKKRQQESDRYRKLTPLSLLLLVFAMLAIIGFSYYGVTRQLAQTQKAARDLDDANRELLLKNKHLENSVEELNAFNYIASHDLKEPLRKILIFTNLILTNEKALSPAERAHLTKIHSAGTRMKNLLADLLTYSQASVMQSVKESVDLNTLVEGVVESFAETISEKNALISYHALPVLTAVPTQMQQLFENLISNSLKYSRPEEPPVITIKFGVVSKWELSPVYTTAHERYYEIIYNDNGIGFEQENAERIFVLFQRLHQRNEFAGTGIGLTICKKIVQNHDGFITAESRVNHGTSFLIYLPAV